MFQNKVNGGMACKLIECVQVHCTRSPLLCALRNTRCSVRLTNFMNSAKKKKKKKKHLYSATNAYQWSNKHDGIGIRFILSNALLKSSDRPQPVTHFIQIARLQGCFMGSRRRRVSGTRCGAQGEPRK